MTDHQRDGLTSQAIVRRGGAAAGDMRLTAAMTGGRRRRRARTCGLAATVALLGCLLAGAPAMAQTPAWMDTSQAPAWRAQQLLSAMTLDEKLAMVHGGALAAGAGAGTVPGNSRLGIPALYLSDGPVGVANAATGVTQWPDAANNAATWDPAAGQPTGSGGGRRVRRQGPQRRAVADREHPARPVVGPGVRDLQRGPVPDQRDGRVGDRRHPEPARHRHGQALRGQQPGSAARRHQRQRLRAGAARDLLPRLRGRGQGRARRVGDVLL